MTTPSTHLATTLRRLSTVRGDPCVTAVLPIEHRTAQPGAANRSLVPALRELRDELSTRWGVAPDRIDDIVSQLEVRPTDISGSAAGLALVVTPDGTTRLPMSTAPALGVVVAAEPDLVGLLPELDAIAPFWLLALTRDHADLLRCKAYGCTAADVVLPTRDEALAYVDDEKVSDVHGGGRAGRGITATHHGGSTATDLRKERTRQYFRAIARAIDPLLRNGREPIVVAAVGSETAVFRDQCTHRPLVELDTGNPDGLDDDELFGRAVAMLRDQTVAPSTLALEHFERLAGTGRTEQAPDLVLVAARDGRVEQLLVADGPHADRSLVRTAVNAVLEHGGDVSTVARDRIGHSDVAAVLRY
jgi:hypothetical protein